MQEASERFYEAVLAAIGIEPTHRSDAFTEWSDFSVAAASDERPVTRGLHVAFAAPSRAHVREFWRTGVDAGYRSDGEPGERPQYRPDYFGAFLLDPDGNSAEAVHHGSLRTGGNVDHLWIRVADVGAARAFYETVAPHGGFRLKQADIPDPPRAQFTGASGSFSLVDDGEPTQNLHLAFAAGDDAVVDAFHRAATGAGYRDNGA